jgi:hypothetical protein
MQLADLNVGAVVHFFDNASHHPKPKFSVIVGISDDTFCLGTVFVNTDINITHINSPELEKLHYKLNQKRYSNFLKHDSYVDCSDVKHRMRTSFLDELNYSGKIVGSLASDDLKNVLTLIMSSDTIAPYYLRLYNIGE